jgi:uncharacterized UBP type Zn finger protein
MNYDACMTTCQHITKITRQDYSRKPNTPNGCEECLKMHDTWVHLRECLSCGHVGCCDSSKNKHATKHYQSSRHPVIKSLESGERWMWCYVDSESAEVY